MGSMRKDWRRRCNARTSKGTPCATAGSHIANAHGRSLVRRRSSGSTRALERHDQVAGEEIFIVEALAGEVIGLAEHESGGHIARFCHRDLGVIDRDHRFLRFAPPRARLRVAPETAVTQQG